MSVDVFDRRLHGVAIYNPDLLSKDELVEQFIARQELLDHLVADLRRPGLKQHQIIVGTRGMGKTTLLRRLRYAIEDDPKLEAVWMPVTFPEEQYNVARLSDLYLNFIDALGDALEHRGRREEADALDVAREGLPRGDESRRAEAALELLLDTAKRLERRLLLLVDNLDLVLERLAKQPGEQWAFREMLSQKHAILLIGAMPVVLGATYDYEAPFYDFFRIHELGGLTRDETRRVLMRMAKQQRAEAVQTLLETDPARIDTLHALTGGNPRTITLLFGVLAQGTDGDVRTDLERLLDQSTPLYKARFEALPAQAQQLVDAIAIYWDPISAGELAEKLSLDVNTVSAQLSRLVQQGVLEKVEYDPPTKIGFQVAERFFNIWYLMRASRRVRRRLIWLVQFLRLFFGAAALSLRAENVLRSAGVRSSADKLRHAEICLAFAEVFDEDKKARSALESAAIRTLVSDDALSRQIAAMLDLEGADASLRTVIDRERWMREFNQAIDALSLKGKEKRELREHVGAAPVPRADRLAVVRKWRTFKRDGRAGVILALPAVQQSMAPFFGSRLAQRFAEALRTGYMDTLSDEAGALAAAVALDAPELEAVFAAKHADGTERLREIVRASDDPFSKLKLACMLAERKNTEALVLVDEAEHQEDFEYVASVRALVLSKCGRLDEAAESLISALKRFPEYESGWRRLGDLLFLLGRVEESLKAYNRALTITRDPATLSSIGGILISMGRAEDAVVMLREALSMNYDQSQTTVYLALAHLLLEDRSEARELIETISHRPDLPTAAIPGCAMVLFSVDEKDLALRLLRDYFTEVSNERAQLPLLFHVLKFAILKGHATAIMDLMEKQDLQDAMQPLYVAVRIAGGESRNTLKRLAPEKSQAAEAILKEWRIASVTKSAVKKLTRRRKRTL